MISPLVFSHIFYKLFSSLNIFPTLQPFSTIRNVKQLKGCSNEDATVMGKISILIGSMANEALFSLSKHFANDGYIFLIASCCLRSCYVQVKTCQAFPCLCYIAVAKKEPYRDTALLNRRPYRQIRPKLHMQKRLDIRGSLGSHKLKSSKKLNAIFAFWLIS